MDTSNFQLIRGERVFDILNEVTLPELERNIVTSFPNTRKRQHATDPVQIVEMRLIPYKGTGDLLVDAVASSGGKKYDTKVMFVRNVQYEDADTDNNVTFTAADGEEYNIQPIDIRNINVKVRCTCLDFRYRFSVWNNSKDALMGDPFPKYRRRTTTRPSVNPDQVPGLCKHLIKTVQAVRAAGLIR